MLYSARVSLERTQMQIEDTMVNLAPDIAVTVEVKTGTRRLIEYLVSISPATALKQSVLTVLLVGLCLLPISVRPLAAADENAPSSNKVTDRPNTAPSTPPEIRRSGDSSVIEGSGSPVVSMPGVPENLNYLFDLPWCSRWRFSCISCERTGDGIKCFEHRKACREMFKFQQCEIYNVPKGCVVWKDGCNFCNKNGCTLKSCPEYLAPNKPSFQCLRYEPDK